MKHRHIEVSPRASIEERPLAALYDLLERGDLDDWRPLLRAIEREPDGRLAESVGRLVDAYPMYGTSPLVRSWIERCRNRSDARSVVGREHTSLSALRRSLGKTQTEVAEAMGISQSDYSKLERRNDVRVSTLRSAAAAVGGQLLLLIELPDRLVEVDIGEGSKEGAVKAVKSSSAPLGRG